MTRHKSRVARRSRHRARRGTRKQSGGWSLSSLWPFGSKTDDGTEAVPAVPAAPAAEAAQSSSFWNKINPFKSKEPETKVGSAAVQNPPPPHMNPGPTNAPALPTPPLTGGRKTRHRRRRSPRHHRK